VPRHRGRAPRRWNLVRLGVGGNWTAHRRAGPARAHGDPAPRQRHLRDGSAAPHAIWRRALTESGSPGGPPTEARVVREEGPRPGRRSTSFVWALASKPGVPQTSPTLFRRESRSGRRRRPGPPGGPSCGGLVRVRGQRRPSLLHPSARVTVSETDSGWRLGTGLRRPYESVVLRPVGPGSPGRAGASGPGHGPVRGLRAGPGPPCRGLRAGPGPPGRAGASGPGHDAPAGPHSPPGRIAGRAGPQPETYWYGWQLTRTQSELND
jgi:hypothetical protein